jgi:uncharacterized protein
MKLTNYYIKYKSSHNNKYLVNTLTGKINVIQDNLYEDFTRIENGELNIHNKSLDFFIQNQYLCNDRDEFNLINFAFEKFQKHIQKHLAIFLYITYDCNLMCTYCNYKYIDEGKNTMSEIKIDYAFEAIAKLIKDSEQEEITFILFGGEPFLNKNKEILFSFLDKYSRFKLQNSSKKHKLITFTNGIEIPLFITKHIDYLRIFDSIYITLGGSKLSHNRARIFPNNKGSYDFVINGVNKLLTENIPVWLVFNSSKSNVNELADINSLIKLNKWDQCCSFLGCCVSRIKSRGMIGIIETYTEQELIYDVSRLIEEKQIDQSLFNFEDMRILKNIERLFLLPDENKDFHQFYGCGNRINQYSFTPDGKIYPCSPSAGKEKYFIGEFYPSFSIKNEHGHLWTYNNVFHLEKCKTCSMAFLCAGGCQYSAREKMHNEKKENYIPDCMDAVQIVYAYIEAVEKNINITNSETIYERL